MRAGFTILCYYGTQRGSEHTAESIPVSIMAVAPQLLALADHSSGTWPSHLPPCLSSMGHHNWRQTQTLMVARDFARHGFQLLHPQVQWVTNGRPGDPSYFSGEFSI